MTRGPQRWVSGAPALLSATSSAGFHLAPERSDVGMKAPCRISCHSQTRTHCPSIPRAIPSHCGPKIRSLTIEPGNAVIFPLV